MKLESASESGSGTASRAAVSPRSGTSSKIDRSGANLVAFHVLGDRSGLPDETISQQPLRPALFAEYRDLSKLRFDFPLILINNDEDQEWVRSLADAIDASLEGVPQEGLKGEEIRRQILNQEHEIRNLVRQGQTASLSSLWEQAEQRLLANASEATRDTLEEHIDSTGAKLKFNGQVVDFDQHITQRMITHAWKKSQRAKSALLGARIIRLTQKLSDILRVDYLRSSAARDAGELEKSLGARDKSVFDFSAMARILKLAPVGEPLPLARQNRIKIVISILESQRFVATNRSRESFNFDFCSCSEALSAYQMRLPSMAALVKAISIAELEIENCYEEARHDAFYSQFDQDQLGPSDLALFPSYLVYLQDDRVNDPAILEILGKGLPFKIVALSDNIIGDMSTSSGQLCFGVQGQQLASMALGLNRVFVLQSSASVLYQLRAQIMQGLASDQPALFSIYSGRRNADIDASVDVGIAPYLIAAAAAESRAFPSFVFDQSAGTCLAEQLQLRSNADPQLGWRKHTLKFVDYKHKDYSKEIVFTPIDFIFCDGRFAKHFAFIPKAKWTDNMVMVDAYLNLDQKARNSHVPYILLVDKNYALYRAVCSIKLIEACNRCGEQWRRLQEMAGYDNVQVLQAVNKARAEWDIERQQLLLKLASASAAAGSSATALFAQTETVVTEAPAKTATVEPVTAPAPSPSSDDPWIETVRCTSCNECTTLNARMFAYNEDKRAYVANPDAGTFRELVEAAENCQVAIIHPGKPRNPDEPGLEELLARAEAFS